MRLLLPFDEGSYEIGLDLMEFVPGNDTFSTFRCPGVLKVELAPLNSLRFSCPKVTWARK